MQKSPIRRLSVIGAGYVGLVTAACLAEAGHEVWVYDIDAEKIERLNRLDIPIYEPGLYPIIRNNMHKGTLRMTGDLDIALRNSEMVLFTVNTPTLPNGDADLTYICSAVETAARQIAGPKLFVVKSTVPVGTCRRLQAVVDRETELAGWHVPVVSNPEFLREGTAIADCFSMERVVIGAEQDDAAAAVESLYRSFSRRIIRTDWESAEMIKYASNIFLAMKVSFINEIANLCELTEADVTQVAEGMGADRRIGKEFLRAGIGYGGSCFPKDTEAMLRLSRRHGYEFRLLRETIAVNRMQRERVLRKLENALGTLVGRTIAVLGLTFKPLTNDMREAPSLWVIPELVHRGAHVKAYDPVIFADAANRFDAPAEVCDSLLEACLHADACLVLTEWKEIVNADWEEIGRAMKAKIAVDGRNCLTPDRMVRAGFQLFGVGTPTQGGEGSGAIEIVLEGAERDGSVFLR